MSTELSQDLYDEDFLRWVADHATPDERARFGPLLRELAEREQRLSLQPKQQLAESLSREADELLYGGAAGGGKALALDTPIPTPTGWTTMGDLHPGDRVLDEAGRPCSVVRTTPTMYDHDCYRVVFDDGTTIVADAEHQWLTFTAKERAQLARRTAEFREQRRFTRPRRGAGSRPDLSDLNQLRATDVLEPPTGGVRLTREIAETLLVGARRNHSVPVAGPLDLGEAPLPVDPYVLGVWLGDGSSRGVGITCADPDILREIEAAGFMVTPWAGKYQFGIRGLVTALRPLGVLRNKHVPTTYLRGSRAQRLALLQGLMDTDGNANDSGSVEFTNTKRCLVEAVVELALSLGHKVTMREGTATLKGRVIGPKWTAKWTPIEPVFRLDRKASRQSVAQRGTQRWRYVVAVEPVPSVPVRCIEVDSPNHLYLASRAMVPTHNSEWLLRHCARQMLRYPGNRGVIFRRVFPSLNRTIIPRAMLLLKPWATYNKVEHTFYFHNGSILELASLQHEDSVTDYQGAEYGVIAFEEVTEFLESQLDFMKSRLRAPVEGPRPHLVATTNPGGVGHAWVKRRYVKPKLDEVSGEELPEPYEVWTPAPTDADPEPLKRCFVPATLKDNPLLTERDPGYLRRIRSLRNSGLRKALEDGDWDAIEAVEGAQWAASQMDYLRVRTPPPMESFARLVVGVDPSGGNKKNNDEQGIVAVGKTFDGQGYVLADRSCKLKTKGWARRAVQLAIDVGADMIVVEPNFGGDMAISPLEDAQSELGWKGKIKPVNSSRGKRLRAEPVAVLYGDPDDPTTWDSAVMHHVGEYEVLEDQMKAWLPADGVSPDHMDAMVFAATEAFDLNHDGPGSWEDAMLGVA